jgi:hypothetical protein
MSEYDQDIDGASAYASGTPVQLEFVEEPAVNGDNVEWTFRTRGGRTAPAGTVAAQIVVMSHDHNILGGGTNTLHSELGPHDIGGGRIHPVQYTPQDGSYYFSITIGEDVRYVSYRIHQRQVSAA